MAVTILTLRPRPTGTEVSVWDDEAKREHVLWRARWSSKAKPNEHGWIDPRSLDASETTDLLAWAQPIITQQLAAETEEAAKEAQVEADLGTKALSDWVAANLDHPDVVDAMRKLAAVRREEIG